MDFETPSIYIQPPEPEPVDVDLSYEVLPNLPDLDRFRTWNAVSFKKRFKDVSALSKVTYFYKMRMGDGEFLSTSTQIRSKNWSVCDDPFEMAFLNELDHTFLQFKKTTGCKCHCFPCIRQKIQVFDSQENLIGTVCHKCSCFCNQVKLVGKDNGGKILFKAKSDDCCGTTKLKIIPPDKPTPVVGTIKVIQDSCTEDKGSLSGFGVSFDTDLDVRVKALIIGAALLADFMYFKAPKPSEDGSGDAGDGSNSCKRK